MCETVTLVAFAGPHPATVIETFKDRVGLRPIEKVLCKPLIARNES
jgi:hypothetical protein